MAKKPKRKKDDCIELSPKHGVNPTLDKCFWCGGSKGVALLGRIRKEGDDDAEAPRNLLIDLQPCDACREKFMTGVLLIEATEDGSQFDNDEKFSFVATGKGRVWPTGRWAVLDPRAIEGGKKGGTVLCGKDTMDKVLAHRGPSATEVVEETET